MVNILEITLAMESKENIGITELKKRLTDSGIDISQWGKGESKTIEHLGKEIAEGETVLENEEGGLIRKVSIVGIKILYVSKYGKKYRLKEDRQIFSDGRERRRSFGHAVSEKIKIGESPELAVVRGVKEELGIDGVINPKKLWEDTKACSSPSYPGLISQYTRYEFELTLDDSQFKPEGYIEEQERLNTYFIWEEEV